MDQERNDESNRVRCFSVFTIVGCKGKSDETGPNGKPNIVISAAADDQLIPHIVSDGSGGAIITWMDSRSGTADIYAQGVSASGRQ